MRLNGMMAVTIAATLAPASHSRAQLAGALGIGSGVGRLGSGAWVRESQFTPGLRVANGAGFLRLDGTAVERAGAVSLQRAALDGAMSSPAFGPFRFTASGQFVKDGLRAGSSPYLASVGTALSAKRGAGGAWIGTTYAAAAEAQLQAGAWRVLRSAVFSVASRTHSMNTGVRRPIMVRDSTRNDTTGGWNSYDRPSGDSTAASRSRRWSDVEGRVDWSTSRLVLSASVSGSRVAPVPGELSGRALLLLWGSAHAALRLNDRVSLIAAGGTVPAGIRAHAAESRFASLGFRLAPAALLREPLPAAVRPSASAFSVQPIELGSYRIVLRVPGARSVELSGDFNNWTAVTLRERAPDVWETTIALIPGTHRVNVRVNGDAWAAPPGLPSVEDEFSGRVGILVIR